MTHKLLQRQLKRLLGVADDAQLAQLLSDLQGMAAQDGAPASVRRCTQGLADFFVQVGEAYSQSERSLELSTRSLELSSSELGQANEHLRQEARQRDEVLQSLRATAKQLVKPLGQQLIDDDQSLSGLTEILSGLVRDSVDARAAAEQAFQQLKDRQFALDQHAIVSITDDAGRIIYANDRFCEISKIARDQLIGRDHRIVNAGVHSKDYFKSMWDTITQGKVWHGEVCNRASDGEIYWVAATIVPFLDQQGQPYQYISLRTDITAQKALEAQIALRERMLGNIMDTLGEGVYLLDEHGRCTYVNPEAERLLGWRREELVGKVLHDVIHMSDAEGAPLSHDRCPMYLSTRSNSVYRSEDEVFTRKDGSRFPVSVVAAPMMEDGRLSGSVAAFQDISARKRTEEELRQSDLKQRMLIDNAADAVVISDGEGLLQYVNEAAIKLLGYSSEELVGVSLFKLLPEGYVQVFRESLMSSLLSTGRVHSEVDFENKQGVVLPLESNVAVLPDGNVYISFRDVTVRRDIETNLLNAKEAAEATSKAKSDFLATMSHEIRTPMNGIIGMTELALDTELDSEQREYLSLVKSSADSLLTIINDILDFSKIESGKMELEMVEFSLHEVLAATTRPLAVRAEQKGLELVYEIDDGVPDLLIGDPGRLRQVLTNLVGNAIKFTERGEISVRVRHQPEAGEEVLLSFDVTDQGIGIAPEKQASIFEAFTQADTSTTRKYGGTGLGLAISSQLAAAMGGGLRVASELGRGSVFTLDTRLIKVRDQRQLADFAELNGVPVLVVDDNFTNLRLLSHALRKWGMVPTLADGAEPAIAAARDAKLRGQAFPLILLDAMMPDVDGFELAARFRASPDTEGAIMMMLSSAGMRGDAQRCRELGIGTYLTKPIDHSELFHAVKGALGAQQAAVKARRPEPVKRDAQKSLDILLAEDNLVNQKLAVALLSKWGHQVTIAENGQIALDLSAERRFDVILMDLQMPVMGGLEATRLIRERERANGDHVPIVAMTANAMSQDHQRCLDGGMDDYVSKPMNTERLRAVLTAVCTPAPSAPTGAAAPAPSPSPAVGSGFDYAGALRAADAWVIETIGQLFLENCPVQLNDFRVALDAGDTKTLVRVAHTLRGLVGNFGAQPIEALAGEIEHADAAAALDIARARLPVLTAEIEALLRDLAVYVAELEPSADA